MAQGLSMSDFVEYHTHSYMLEATKRLGDGYGTGHNARKVKESGARIKKAVCDLVNHRREQTGNGPTVALQPEEVSIIYVDMTEEEVSAVWEKDQDEESFEFKQLLGPSPWNWSVESSGEASTKLEAGRMAEMYALITSKSWLDFVCQVEGQKIYEMLSTPEWAAVEYQARNANMLPVEYLQKEIENANG